jgi:hypothetical protein
VLPVSPYSYTYNYIILYYHYLLEVAKWEEVFLKEKKTHFSNFWWWFRFIFSGDILTNFFFKGLLHKPLNWAKLWPNFSSFFSFLHVFLSFLLLCNEIKVWILFSFSLRFLKPSFKSLCMMPQTTKSPSKQTFPSCLFICKTFNVFYKPFWTFLLDNNNSTQINR